ncbi:MAG: YajQ family cyclic di-GMP-binding protein [Mariprofundales bacterium]|nr:YajQ family cyclic di-GMP-binding protein [Mariprofundales bacterium]
MPSFDIVCETDMQEVSNACNQTHKEITTRYDFKNSSASITLNDGIFTIIGDDEHKVESVTEILRGKMVRRKLDPKLLEYGALEDASGGLKRQIITIKQGVERELAKRIVKQVKQEKMRVQAAIQGDQVRISGKKRDDLQAVIAMIRTMECDRPLQCINFRD